MKITVLDAATLGADVSMEVFSPFGEVTVYETTSPDEVALHAAGAEVLLLNKVRLNAENLRDCENLRLICVAATGFDNIDLDYCRLRGIAVCNVVGYSTQSVAQLTVAMALSLMTNLPAFDAHVRSGAYTANGIPNCLTPTYHEIAGKTFGIVGFGNIGRQVGSVARALGCRVLVNKRTPVEGWDCVSLEELCRESDILSIHTPLNDSTRDLIDRAHIAMMKPNAIVINVARGAVTDEQALADALLEGRLGGLGVDVYSAEPMSAEHPFYPIRQQGNVCFTPHMAWGAYETRVRLLGEMAENIRSFLSGGTRNRVDLK